MTDTANGTRVSVHDLHGDDLDAHIASHVALWGFPPLAGGQDPDDDEPDGDKPKDDTTDHAADAEKWKALAKKHEKRAKENAGAATRLAELEEEGKTDSQRRDDQLATEKARADKAEGKLLRIEVALDKAPEGMKPSQVLRHARRLDGATREELEEDAADLFADYTPPKGSDNDDPDAGGGKDDKDDDTPSGRSRPREVLKPGAAPNADPDDADTDPDTLAAKVPRHY